MECVSHAELRDFFLKMYETSLFLMREKSKTASSRILCHLFILDLKGYSMTVGNLLQ